MLEKQAAIKVRGSVSTYEYVSFRLGDSAMKYHPLKWILKMCKEILSKNHLRE